MKKTQETIGNIKSDKAKKIMWKKLFLKKIQFKNNILDLEITQKKTFEKQSNFGRDEDIMAQITWAEDYFDLSGID